MKNKMRLFTTIILLIFFSCILSATPNTNAEELESIRVILTFDSQIAINEWAKSRFNDNIDSRNSITDVIITGDITYVPSSAFCDMTSLQSIDMINSVVYEIKDSAFWGCTHLETILFSGYTHTIGEEAFYGTAIRDLSVPSNIKVIEAGAFDYCLHLETVRFEGDSITLSSNFNDCIKLHDIEFPSSVIISEPDICYGCVDLKEITIPASVHNIMAFAEQSGLKRLVIGGSGVLFAHSPGNTDLYPQLTQMVFLQGPPKTDEEILEGYEDYYLEWGMPYGRKTIIYYLKDFSNIWSPNGETEWNGIPIIGIDSLDDLPPVE